MHDGHVDPVGLVGDGVSDDWQAIQDAIDSAVNSQAVIVRLPIGKFRISQPLILGYRNRDGFAHVQLVGVSGYDAHENKCSLLLPDMEEGPAVVIGKSRNTGLENVKIKGRNQFWVEKHSSTYKPSIMADLANFIASNVIDTPENPYCGVKISKDASRAFVRRCAVEWFAVGIASQPDADSNGDFTDLSHTAIRGCASGVSFGNVNARSTDFESMLFDQCHTCIDGVNYRRQTVNNKGNIAGHIANIHANQVFQIFNVDLAWGVGVNVGDCYAENIVRIGEAVSAGSAAPLSVNGSFNMVQAIIAGDEIADAYATPPIKYGGAYVLRDSMLYGYFNFAELDGIPKLEGVNSFRSTAYLRPQELASGEEAYRQTCSILSSQNMTHNGPDWIGNSYVAGIGFVSDHDTKQATHIWSRSDRRHGVSKGYTSTPALRRHESNSPLGNMVVNGRSVAFDIRYLNAEVGAVMWIGGVFFSIDAIAELAPSHQQIEATALTRFSVTNGVASLLGFNYQPGTVWYYMPPNMVLSKTGGEFYVRTQYQKNTATVTLPNGIPFDNHGLTGSEKLFWIGGNGAFNPDSPFPNNVRLTAVDGPTLTFSSPARRTGRYALTSGIHVA